MSSEAKLPTLIAEVESATHHRNALYACLSDLTLIPNTGLNDSGKALYARLRVDRCNHHRHALYACLFDLTLIPNTGMNDSGKGLYARLRVGMCNPSQACLLRLSVRSHADPKHWKE